MASSDKRAASHFYTRCPSCATIFALEFEQLISGRGQAFCVKCQRVFDTLPSLSQSRESVSGPSNKFELPQLVEPTTSSPKDTLFREPRTKQPSPILIRISLVLCLLMLIAALTTQIWLTRRDQLVQMALLRPAFHQICTLLHCQVPPYHSVEQLLIEEHSLQRTDKNQLLFDLSFVNTADEDQTYPDIQLDLLSLNGEKVTQQTFPPEIYLPYVNHEDHHLLASGKIVNLSLPLAIPEHSFSGYEIRFR